jgi:hypothetical protein
MVNQFVRQPFPLTKVLAEIQLEGRKKAAGLSKKLHFTRQPFPLTKVLVGIQFTGRECKSYRVLRISP